MSSQTKLQYTPLSEIPSVHAKLRSTFKSGVTLPLAYRRRQLLQLARLVQDNIKALEDAQLTDLGKPRFQVAMVELGPVISSALNAANHLEEWTKPEKPTVEEWRASWDATIYKVPQGVALIISPWNYPFILTFNPLVGAIAAGCPVVLKPSENTPTCSALIAELVPKYLDPDAYIVVNGGAEETSALLKLRWDHIFFTGGGKIGKIIASAAAKFITPVTLELGGKSPVIIDTDCDIDLAAKRTLYGKLQNSGQLCVSPDYVLVPRSILPKFLASLEKYYKQFWPNHPLHPDSQWSKIVNQNHHSRVADLINRTKGEVVLGGELDAEGRKIAPTVISGVSIGDSLMEDENFGPVLPILPVEDVDEAIGIISERPTPLVLYAFTDNDEVKQKLIAKTQSGSLVLNDTTTQLAVHEIPFGGHGESGYGRYHGNYTFELFTHRRSFINIPNSFEEVFEKFRYPPYTEEAYKFAAAAAHQKIPDA